MERELAIQGFSTLKALWFDKQKPTVVVYLSSDQEAKIGVKLPIVINSLEMSLKIDREKDV